MKATIKKRNGYLYLNDVRIIKKLHEGQQSKNYIAEMTKSTGEPQKILLQILQDNKEDITRLQILQQIKGMNGVSQLIYHWYKPIIVNTVQSFDTLEQDILKGQLFLFYEYCPYPQLSIDTFNDQSFASSQDLVKAQMELFNKMCKIIYELNKKRIYHFDIQPENILTDGKDVMIIDFGAAQQLHEHNHKQKTDEDYKTFTYIQTPAFSPYKYDFKNYEIQADKYDVYSLGCILYFMLTKQYLIKPLTMDSQNTYQLQQQYGWEIFTLIQQMTEVDAMYRFTIEEVINHPIFKSSSNQYSKILNHNSKFRINYQKPPIHQKLQFELKACCIRPISDDCLFGRLPLNVTKINSVQEYLYMYSDCSDIPNTEHVEEAQYIRYNTIKYYLFNGMKKLSAFKKKNKQYISRSLSNQYSSENISINQRYFDDTYVEKLRNQLDNKVNIQLKYFIPDYMIYQKKLEYDCNSIQKLNQQQKDYFQQIQVNKIINNYINQYLPHKVYYINLQKKITHMIYQSQVDYNKFTMPSSDSEGNIYGMANEESTLSKNASEILLLFKNVDRNSIVEASKRDNSSKIIHFEEMCTSSDVFWTDETCEETLISTSCSSQSLKHC